MNDVLKIRNLQTSFKIQDDYYAAVDDVSLDVKENEVVAIVGESGCGKSALAYSIMGLHNKAKTKIEGKIYYKDEDIAKTSISRLNKLRGSDIGMIFQDPMTALNPLMTIGNQIEETLILHKKMSDKARKDRVIELLNDVGIPRPEHIYHQYPHQLSGGMRQRIVIAIAIANKPSLLIADEPTTALDVTIQSQILDLMKDLKEEIHAGVIMITHDLGVVAEMADRVAVMYAGQIVELATVEELFDNPQHPYTRSLLESVPSKANKDERLHVIQGVVPPLPNLPRNGCRFKSRIPWIAENCHEENPALHEVKQGHFVRCTCYKHFHFMDEQEGEKQHGAS
ncbi:ABC transporter ATP-binding protein [Gracilibacillus sp. S3-1-1]|uniref:ABC transporter ATP-binding protein n=1 Tax=Gracilibacillus pellucidus TaxID=3095368 RepID=A0ACC6M731_9BACI|nr:ABC transporter ATP-binding protein [Gracilibacillus sp. S3-1-1]MDX8046668.1 ABC transporter ATP-binding protein [Gracilibacillus sp. S3-1-1]